MRLLGSALEKELSHGAELGPDVVRGGGVEVRGNLLRRAISGNECAVVRQNLTLEIRVVTVPCQNELKNMSIVKSRSERNPVEFQKKGQLLEIDCFHMSSTVKSLQRLTKRLAHGCENFVLALA